MFVNSIKTARRLDGLLRALGINCRTLHAQLQQKQRLNALESFANLPVGVLGECCLFTSHRIFTRVSFA